MQEPRDYQRRAVNEAIAEMHRRKRVIIACPTGGGKTLMASMMASRAQKSGSTVLAICHRTELVQQLEERLPDPKTVATIQWWLRAREARLVDSPGLLILDECHHYAADEWKTIITKFQFPTRILGLTATPERADGKPLGNAFDSMVVASSYPELVRAGHLVDVDVMAPTECLAPDLAQEPVKAWRDHCSDRRSFIYCRTVKEARRVAREIGTRAGCITGETPKEERREALDKFRSGELDVLTNVYCLTEGVDVPDADCCILARGCSHASVYLQMVGRVLRAYPGKERALLVDLAGVSRLFGSPVAERTYSLSRGIELTSAIKVCECPACGYADKGYWQTCPKCGHTKTTVKRRPRILNRELALVYRAELTPDFAKSQELNRLVGTGKPLWWVANEYRRLFGVWPVIKADNETKFKTLTWLRRAGSLRQAGFKFKCVFGHWPQKTS